MIDERFRRMLMMDYATKEGQKNQGFFGGNQQVVYYLILIHHYLLEQI